MSQYFTKIGSDHLQIMLAKVIKILMIDPSILENHTYKFDKKLAKSHLRLYLSNALSYSDQTWCML